MAATIPESIHRSSSDGCVHAWDPVFILCYGWLRPYHIYIMYLRYQLYVFSQVLPHVLVKHFTPLSLMPHALGGICYTVICHRLSPSLLPLSRILEDPFRDL